MCKQNSNEINVLYLIDISFSAVPQQSHFNVIAALIQDVTISTLSTDAFNQIILYDENRYIQAPQTDAAQIDITQYSRTPLVNLQSAILTAIETLNALDQKRSVLVIFSGQLQNDYSDDTTEICPLRAILDDNGMIVVRCHDLDSKSSFMK